ncbi:bifunctional folylpolyglutamate synthase/dihydrofolate synthase [Spirosoma utsteinense]|uniref:Dihydrofolate synthase/folylpolyglutamate synthase n=1 Tax=Spirosoma utsteinense TaxID=2585773 RepID=A0ABR6WAZ4_9BACT|nr:folylpolyglutamate synthase/dihydrofolate synthase family protein [Spirosoma utsteinense]MBC3785791.1 dihydrofolate synthase/folylpolyglutamate synthase [Spirosoma utsteinense]MBC3793682.1 dihydrofolate synthase/folylpolyglutamate synthase [Spirosoma utsteinense]
MQYSEVIDYLYSRLPVFHRIGAKALKPGLGNTLRLCAALGNPQDQFRSIHVAGTNGKGSTSHMLASIYGAAGYRVGLYTSPHLKSFTERIRINGQPISEEAVAEFVTKNRDTIETVEPSFFEVTVAMAFDFFARQDVDLAIIEVGLGGRLDSTNVITPLISVITNIGYDHTDILGDTLSAIATEKAGIIKAGVPVVVGETQAETESVFRSVAALANAPISFADQQYSLQDSGITNGRRLVTTVDVKGAKTTYRLDLLGQYQLRNLPAVLATITGLQTPFPVAESAQQIGLASVVSSTGLKGRFQVLQQEPFVVADTAHNEAGLRALFAMIETFPRHELRIVLGLVADKDRASVLSVLPKEAVYYFCQAQTPRALPADTLQREAESVGLSGAAFPDVDTALQAALSQSTPTDLIVVTGSNYIIAEITNL